MVHLRNVLTKVCEYSVYQGRRVAQSVAKKSPDYEVAVWISPDSSPCRWGRLNLARSWSSYINSVPTTQGSLQLGNNNPTPYLKLLILIGASAYWTKCTTLAEYQWQRYCKTKGQWLNTNFTGIFMPNLDRGSVQQVTFMIHEFTNSISQYFHIFSQYFSKLFEVLVITKLPRHNSNYLCNLWIEFRMMTIRCISIRNFSCVIVEISFHVIKFRIFFQIFYIYYYMYFKMRAASQHW